MVDIDKSLIPCIDNALGFTLTAQQISYITGGVIIPTMCRQTGKTTAYCIKLALQKGKTFNIHDISDRTRKERLYEEWFKCRFLEIRILLYNEGLEVCDLIFDGGYKL